MALETRRYGRKPGIAIAMETVLVLLALRPLELSWTLAPWGDKEEQKIHELMNAISRRLKDSCSIP